MAAQPIGYFALVLHSHLPFVIGHGKWPHGSDWLMEVAVGCYLPLLDAATALTASGISPHMTIDISPVLAEQLASAAFRTEFDDYLRARIQSARENRTEFEAAGRGDLANLATGWERLYRDRLEQFERLNGDLLGRFRHLADEGHLTLITCAATHGYLPLLSREESVDLQLRVAVATHQRHFGRPPGGIWLPECGYRPRYEWTPPVGPHKGRVHLRRRGIEEFLAQFGIKFFITDTHLMRGGSPLSAYRDYYPALHLVPGPQPPSYRPDRSPYRPYLIASRGGGGSAAAFVRDPETTLQVWSRERGYPGDGWYLEFHKKHFPGGLRYWRVTEAKTDLGAKLPYDPTRAQEQTRAHAEHFTDLLHRVLAAAPDGPQAIVCSPYDTELFGHWWFEGPRWLQEVFARLPQAGIVPQDCVTALQARPPQETTTLLEGSWGEGGDHRVWLNHETEWTWERVYGAEDEFWTLAKQPNMRASESGRRLLSQLARELLLLQASDWQFLITTWAARDYAEARVAEHYATFTRLAQMLHHVASGGTMPAGDEEFLAAREAQNFVFPDVLTHVVEASRTTAA
ncbi:MAG TPA: 1,4-alpha-glucan branching protein domain-containing protein [bacterium]|nr:1,4-alpha-glucan branching protein domain-containing protein [bacterium]